MKKWFSPNLETTGRLVRGACGLLLLAGAIYAATYAAWLSVILLVSAGFVLFEAVRGWCIMRACGIKTKY